MRCPPTHQDMVGKFLTNKHSPNLYPYGDGAALPYGSTRRQRSPRSDRLGPTPHQRPCSALLCSSRCSLTCLRKQELHSYWKHTHTQKLCIDNCIQHMTWISKSESQAPSSTNNWPPETSQHQELSLGAPEYAVGLLLVKHLCIKKTWQKCFMNTRLYTTGSTGQLDGSPGTHSRARSFRYFWHDKRRRWFWETLRGEQQTCCHWVPRQMLWCFLENRETHGTSGFCSSPTEICLPPSSPFISTTSTGTCFSLIRKISKLVTTPWQVSKMPLNISPFLKTRPCVSSFVCVPVFLSESCPLSHTGNLHFSASAVCSPPRWRGCGPESPGGKVTASESLWLGCPCPRVPRMLWCYHQETTKSPCRHIHGKILKILQCCNRQQCYIRQHLLNPTNFKTLLVQQSHRLKHKGDCIVLTFCKVPRFNFSNLTYWSLIDTQRVCGHPGEKLPIMTPPERKTSHLCSFQVQHLRQLKRWWSEGEK